MSRFAILTMAILLTMPVRALNNAGIVQGTVKTSAGQPVAGAFVKLTNAEKRLTFMVVSQSQGRFTASDLPPGRYMVQGIGNGFQSKFAIADVASSKAALVNLSLTDARGPYVPNGWPGTPGIVGGTEVQGNLPPPKLPDGNGKAILQTKCARCHDLYRVVLLRRTYHKWEETVDEMRERMQGDPAHAKDLTDQEAKVLVDYLASNYSYDTGGANPKPDPNGRLPRTLLNGDGSKYIAVDFEIPDPDTQPHDITVDSRGNAWVDYLSGCCLGKFDRATYAYTIVHPPDEEKARMGNPSERFGDSIWAADSGNRRWLQLDTRTLQFTTYPLPKALTGPVGGNTMRVHPDGKTVWSSNDNRIMGLNIATKQFVTYDIPSFVKTKRRVDSYGIAIAADGKIWFAEKEANLIGRLDPATGVIDEYKTPVAKNPGEFDNPRRMGEDGDGNIWVALHQPSKLVKIDFKTAAMKVYDIPTTDSGPYSVVSDKKNNLIWFSDKQASDKIGRYNPKNNTWTEFSLPIVESDARRIELDPTNPNRIWWSGDTSNHLGYIEVLAAVK